MKKNLIAVPLMKKTADPEKILEQLEDRDCDILVVYNGSPEEEAFFFTPGKSVNSIAYSDPEGIGSLIMTAFDYASHLEYENIIIHDTGQIGSAAYIPELLENLAYGYDLVNFSRVLENYGHEKIPAPVMELIGLISSSVNEATDFSLTDPMSGIFGAKVKSLENMEYTEYSGAMLLQMWVQAAHYGLVCIELPVETDREIGSELDFYEDPAEACLSLIETEKCLYGKGSIN